MAFLRRLGTAAPDRHSRCPGRLVPRASRGSLQSGAGHCADLIPDDHTGNEFLSHPFRRPVCLAAPAEEAVIGLGLDAPGLHFFGQAIGRGEDEGASGTEELDRSCGFAAAPSAGSLMG